jgi:hypothetical protein
MKKPSFPVGARVLVDGYREAKVRGAFPSGSTSYLFPHYLVDLGPDDRNVAVHVDRVGVDRREPLPPWMPGDEAFVAAPDEVIAVTFVAFGTGGRNFRIKPVERDMCVVKRVSDGDEWCCRLADLYVDATAAAIRSSTLGEEALRD